MFYTAKDHWADVREQESTLPEFAFIVSLEDKPIGRTGGVVVEASRATAARAIVGRTHRLATPAEVNAHKEAEHQKATAALAEARRKAGICSYVLAPVKEKG